MRYESGMAMVSGDFDGDGDLDFIIGAHDPEFATEGRAYFYENDGDGNFRIKKPQPFNENTAPEAEYSGSRETAPGGN